MCKIMIKKTLIITIQEKDSITKELHDIVELKRGNKTENIVLKFANPSGQLLVDKQDLYDGIREIEAFYSEKSESNTSFAVTVQGPTSSGEMTIVSAEADHSVYLAPEYGDDQ